MTKKILHITQFLSPGGLERMIWTLSLELKRIGHQSDVFVYDHEGGTTIDEEISKSGIAVFAHYKKNGFSASTVWTLRKLIKENRYDAIHSHDLGALIYAGLANIGLKTIHVHTQHSFIHFEKSWLMPFYEKIFCALADSIVTVSPHQVQDYQKLKIKSRAITNGVDYPSINPYELSKEDRRKSLLKNSLLNQNGTFGDVPSLQKKWILIPGRIQRSKGQHLLFCIMDKLSDEELKSIHFIIIGASTHEADRVELLKKYQSNNRYQHSLSYLGFHSNPLEWMSSSDGIMLLSSFEGFPLVPLESLGLGLPTLLSDIEPHRFLQNEATLINLENMDAAAGWIKEQLNSSDPHWDERKAFREKYSVAKMASQYLLLYGGQS